MSRTVSPSSGKPYGLALVCRAWRAPRATVYRHRAPPGTEPLRARATARPARSVLRSTPFAARAGPSAHGGPGPGLGPPCPSSYGAIPAVVRAFSSGTSA